VFSLVFLSLAQLIYLGAAKPYEDPKVNRLELFNECIVMLCNYHLFFFVDPSMSSKLKYLAGWSLDLIIILQFLLNSYIYVQETILIFRMYARGYYRRLMHARKHAAERREEEEEEEKSRSENDVISIDNPEPYRLGPVTEEKLLNEPKEYTP
jgi:hypothetical protein